MFSASFPLAPLLVLILALIEVRVDGFKLYRLLQRPFPLGSKSIGPWLEIIRFLSLAGIFSNVSMIVYTSKMVTTDNAIARRLVWVSAIFALYIIKDFIAYVIPDVPELYKKTNQWQKRIIEEKLFQKYSSYDKTRRTNRRKTSILSTSPFPIKED